MISVSIKQLVQAIEEADIFRMPEISTGTEYLYNNLYGRLSLGNDVSLSSLDFDAFEPEDIDSLRGLHTDVFERNGYAANGIMSDLRRTAPVYKAVSYV